ncbi:hypothetical protein Anapl_03218 [Anas platyrhynchos]|uniref:Uncharacterized protein n=1 Tax=Anas platyrhynchos TaxID=8839 RepID=R0JKN5_ANAPL|nr:hypothetical protein Anapl_03218 [Anas platyrhynchos]
MAGCWLPLAVLGQKSSSAHGGVGVLLAFKYCCSLLLVGQGSSPLWLLFLESFVSLEARYATEKGKLFYRGSWIVLAQQGKVHYKSQAKALQMTTPVQRLFSTAPLAAGGSRAVIALSHQQHQSRDKPTCAQIFALCSWDRGTRQVLAAAQERCSWR